MDWRKWLEKWEMTSLKIKTPFLDMDWKPQDEDKAAAWELYVELLTRITTQPLDEKHGDEKTALDSVYSLFALTRDILKSHSRSCMEFTKIAVVILNQVVRPFSAKWHPVSLRGELSLEPHRTQFRAELAALQVVLRRYTRMLADMAGVEDLTGFELVEQWT